MTVGVMVLERGGEFADFRITRDWKRVACFAPDLEMEMLEHLEREVRERLGSISGRDELMQLLTERFGNAFDVGPAKAMIAADPAAEIRVLERDYLAPMIGAMREPRGRGMGRLGIVGRMEAGFATAGVLEMLQKELDMREYLGENDPFRVDFGFRVGRSLKMFHALALNLSPEPAVMLAYRYARIRDGMRERGDEALMTAIVSEGAARARGELASGVAMLRANEVAVRDVGEIEEMAEELRRELLA